MPIVDLDRFDFLYARRVQGLRSSAARDLMSMLSRPGIISLAGGFPDTKSFGGEALKEIAGIVADDSARALQYGPTGGLDEIKDTIVEVMEAEGTAARQEDIFLTTGAQQGLDLIGRVFIDEGDGVICEAPTYVGALNAFASYRPRILHVPLDRFGLDVTAAEEAIKSAKKKNIPVKFIYTVPNFQNPAGVTLSGERRRQLLELAREHDIIIVEDNPYGVLRYDNEAPPTISSMEQEAGDPERVVYLGTFSKIFAPGVRLGWVHAQQGIIHKVNVGKQAADLCSSNLSQMLIVAYFKSGEWKGYVRRLVKIYRERRDTMLDALAEFMPKEVNWTHPEGGFFVWVTLPEYIDATAMLPQAITRNVAYVPGEGFYANGEGKNCMRLNFSFVEPDKIRKAIERLSEVIKERMEFRDKLEAGSKKSQGPAKSSKAHSQAADTGRSQQ